MQSLYLIKCQQYYKIGVTINIRDRMAQLATGNPFELDLKCLFEFEDANCVELALHQKFSRQRTRGDGLEPIDEE